jgi:hypothetical protein
MPAGIIGDDIEACELGRDTPRKITVGRDQGCRLA